MEVEHGKPRAEINLVLKALEALGLSVSVDRQDMPRQTAEALDIVDIDAIVRNAKAPTP
jgi:HTH-type transcriptional regulator/antitoxin HipB